MGGGLSVAAHPFPGVLWPLAERVPRLGTQALGERVTATKELSNIARDAMAHAMNPTTRMGSHDSN
jgi:hypothetical protein